MSSAAARSMDTAIAHLNQGRLPEAEALLAKLVRNHPKNADALQLLGMVCARQGRLVEAIRHLEQAVRRAPDHVAARFNLGNALRDAKRPADAARQFEAVLKANPNFVPAMNGYGCTLLDLLRPAEAVPWLERAAAADPALTADALCNLATALKRLEKLDAAETACRRSLTANPRHAPAWANLGNILSELGQFAEAHDAYSSALTLRPRDADSLFNRANTLVELGRLEEAEHGFRQAIQVDPDHAGAHRVLMFSMLYNTARTPQQIADTHRAWGRQIQQTVQKTIRQTARKIASRPPVTPLGGRPLRVGYLSPDFRQHAVAAFFEPVLTCHDPARVEVTCYAQIKTPDATTARLKQKAARWRDTLGMTDAELAARIRADKIDILVDMAGHTIGSRTPVLAYTPAPLQATWLGYPATLGLDAVDIRLTDQWADPPGNEAWNVESLLRLPGPVCCFGPPEAAPPVSPLPADSAGIITFGSLMNTLKINAQVIALWARVLHRVPGSRLLLRRKSFASAELRERYQQAFAAHGIGADRVLCDGQRNMSAEHFLSTYNDLDITLDTFPYAGHTTTCESLWMGAPVVTLAGKAYVERMGVSVLSSVGRPEWIAATPERYVEIAAELASDLPALRAIRASLRGQMAASPLCDAAGFTRQLEDTLHALWRQRCAD